VNVSDIPPQFVVTTRREKAAGQEEKFVCGIARVIMPPALTPVMGVEDAVKFAPVVLYNWALNIVSPSICPLLRTIALAAEPKPVVPVMKRLSIAMDAPEQSKAVLVLLVVAVVEALIVEVNQPDAKEAIATVMAMRRMDASNGDIPFISSPACRYSCERVRYSTTVSRDD